MRIWQSPDAAVTEGMVEVRAAPAVVFAAITDYPRWPQLFSDVAWVKVKGGGRDDALVQYQSRTFGRGCTFKFRNLPDRLVRYDLFDGPSGVQMFWEAALEPVGGSGATRIRARLHTVVGGIYGWLVSAKSVRKHRESKLRRDLGDLRRRFGPFEPPASQR